MEGLGPSVETEEQEAPADGAEGDAAGPEEGLGRAGKAGVPQLAELLSLSKASRPTPAV